MHDIYLNKLLTEKLKEQGKMYCTSCGNWVTVKEGFKIKKMRNSARFVCNYCVARIEKVMESND